MARISLIRCSSTPQGTTMKLTEIADTIKHADGKKLDHLTAAQVARILSRGLQEIRAAIESSGDEVVIVPGFGRFRSQLMDVKPKSQGEGASTRRVTRFVPAPARAEEAVAATAAAQ
jgi:nucleoid DNA-binding protein